MLLKLEITITMFVSHNLQENKDKKMQGNYPQTFPPTTIKYRSSCHFLTFGGQSNNVSSN
jgi:hypothetical protein